MLLRRLCFALGLGFAVLPVAQAQRLPAGLRPQHYALTITPDLAKARFTASEQIDLQLDHATDSITLNAAELQFASVTATASGATAQTADVALDAAKQQAKFTFPHVLAAGPVTLRIEYTGILNDKLRGFYLSKTRLRNYGVTQFESTDARRAFPCFDEPALKATFDITLVIDAGDTAFSNMQIIRDTPGPAAGQHSVVFATTPRMSTYLVAWLVGDFQCVQGKSDGVPIRACATPEKAGLTRFALEAAKWDLHYYDKYFGIKYPLKKLDLVAIPDFEAGAMENFGCITFRETELLVDQKSGTLDAKKEVTRTVAHEMSHQWFGDLVTPAWWDNLWLNEGFATWMETKAAAAWQPRWGFAEDVALEKDRTMNEDAGRATRPIQNKVETPAEIDESFDDIAYGKAGAVVSMVENWVGAEVFRKGVHAYLAAHLYGNATGEDFWDAQTQASGQPVDQVMRSFVEQPGLPLVRLSSEGTAVHASQQRFSITGAPSAPESWAVPLCVKGAACRVLLPGVAALEVPQPSGIGFLDANAEDKGYYRTLYAPQEWSAIVAGAESGLTPEERIGLLGDRWALVRSGDSPLGSFLDLVLAMKHDQDATVMDLALSKLDIVEEKIATAEDLRRMDALVRREFGPVYAALGGASRHESPDHADLRGMLFEELGRAQDPGVLAEAGSITQQLLAGKKAADPRIADAAVALATRKGDSAMYDKLMNVAQAANDPDLKEAALNALTQFEEPLLVIRTLEYAVSGAVRNQDSLGLIAELLARRPTQELAWQFVQQHWEQIERQSTAASGARIVEATGSFCTVAKHEEVAEFFAAHPVAEAQRTLAQALASIDECVALRATGEPELQRWLDAQAIP